VRRASFKADDVRAVDVAFGFFLRITVTVSQSFSIVRGGKEEEEEENGRGKQ
jgi:hypothetical protein